MQCVCRRARELCELRYEPSLLDHCKLAAPERLWLQRDAMMNHSSRKLNGGRTIVHGDQPVTSETELNGPLLDGASLETAILKCQGLLDHVGTDVVDNWLAYLCSILFCPLVA